MIRNTDFDCTVSFPQKRELVGTRGSACFAWSTLRKSCSCPDARGPREELLRGVSTRFGVVMSRDRAPSRSQNAVQEVAPVRHLDFIKWPQTALALACGTGSWWHTSTTLESPPNRQQKGLETEDSESLALRLQEGEGHHVEAGTLQED